MGQGWLILMRVWVGGQGSVLSHSLFFLFLFVVLSFGLSCPVSFFK